MGTDERDEARGKLLRGVFKPRRPPGVTAAMNNEARPALSDALRQRLISQFNASDYEYSLGDYVLIASKVLSSCNSLDRQLAEALAAAHLTDPEYTLECAKRELREITIESLHCDRATSAAAAIAFNKLCFEATAVRFSS